MVGAGAVAGMLSGGYTNAARSPDVIAAGADRSPAVARAGVEASVQGTHSNTTTVNMTVVSMTVVEAARATPDSARNEPVRNEPAPAAVIALRFPAQWQQPVAARATTDDNDPPPQALAYVTEPQRVEPVRPAAASSSGFALASVDPEAVPMPKRIARPAPAKPAVLFNDAQLASIKARLKLTRDQEQYWPQVEQALRAISWKLATQPNAQRVVRGNQASMIDPNSPEVARLKSAAVPLIMSMREDQKQEVRQLAHTMGLKQVAAMF
jgi:hypothetical protein